MRAISSNQVFRKTIYLEIWQNMTSCEWTKWDSCWLELKERGIAMDDVLWTLKIHGFILSHRHRSEQALLQLEEMKRNEMVHPCVLRLNERMVQSYFELQDINCEPPRSAWINLAFVAWTSSLRLVRARKSLLRKQLEEAPPNEVVKLTKEDVKLLLKETHRTSPKFIEQGDADDVNNNVVLPQPRLALINETKPVKKKEPSMT